MVITLVDRNNNSTTMSHYNPDSNPNPNPNHNPPIVEHHHIPSVFAVVPNNPSPNPNPNSTYISVVDHQLPYDTHNLYDVFFHSHTIPTLLTTTPSFVDSWISDTLRLHRRRLRHLIVGLDVEWRPNFHSNSQNPVATLQLCVGHRCLVFQILHAPFIPQSLVDFLGNADHTFVGVGIEEDVEKLLEDYSLRLANSVDIRKLSAERLGERELKSAGLKTLSLRVLGLEVQKPKRITMSKWDNPWLTADQVKYACVDAFVSFEIGRSLIVFSGR